MKDNKFPTNEDIEKKFPCEAGQSIIMEDGMNYEEVIRANYFRRQGANWLKNKLINKKEK